MAQSEILDFSLAELAHMRQYHPWAISFFSTRYDIDTILGFFLDTIRYRYNIRALEKTFFLRNFRRIFWIFREFSEFSENFLNFRRIFGISREFSGFSENFRNFRRIFGGKTQNKSILRYSILEVWYYIFFDMLKSPIYWHSIISRYDKPIPGQYLSLKLQHIWKTPPKSGWWWLAVRLTVPLQCGKNIIYYLLG